MSHKKYRSETDCLNCGAQVNGKFCSECGQENLEVRDGFFHLVGHFIADYFHYDSKFLRSMKLLFFKPGFLTKQYWDGKRGQYIHPLRLYFFVIVIGVLVGGFFFENYKDAIRERIMMATVNFNSTKQDVDQDSTSSERPSINANGDLQFEMDEATAKQRIVVGIDRFIGQLKYIMFGLLPLYALIFKILYIRRKSFFVDHLIYAMHLQSFAFLSRLGFALLAFLIPVLDSPLKWISYGLIMAYTAISLRYLYSQSWWKTVLKSLIATVLIVLTIAVVFVTYITIAIFS